MTALTHTHTQPQRKSSAQNRKCVEKQDMKRQCLYVDCFSLFGLTEREKEWGRDRERTSNRKCSRKKDKFNATSKILFKNRERERQTEMWKYRLSHLPGLCCRHPASEWLYWLFDCMTHPSPSFSRTSKTSSGCLVRLSSLSFFNCLKWHKGREIKE